MNVLTVFRRGPAIEVPQEANAALPTEFRIFAYGKIETTEGVDVFDEVAARSVMAFYAKEGVDVPIDLEHDSFDSEARAHRSDARDARGWLNLELRDDGLYAVNVRWAPDGARRLREKTQKYTSAAFLRDEETGRITRLLNVAITSAPATHNALPLVASRALRSASTQEVARALDAALYDKFPRSDTAPGAYACDIYPDAVIVDYDGKLLRIPYTYVDGIATLTGEPVQVTRQYVPVGAAARRVAIALAERRLASCKSRATLRNT